MNAQPIFISYRRDDEIATAEMLQLHLQNMFGSESVFRDTKDIKYGDDFPDYLKSAMAAAKVVIVMIGKNWKGTDPKINRLEQENDWVRKELEMALEKSGAPKIIPLLVKGATAIESFKDLPHSIEALGRINCAELREKEFRQDLVPLIPIIEPLIGLSDPLRDLPLDDEKYGYPKGSPFKGLDYFTEKDAKLFFGRGKDIRKLYNIVSERNIVFFYGQSGVGKSSLLFAGLKPRMNFKGWNISYYRREAGINIAEKLDEYISTSDLQSKQLVILDQVEEIFTYPNSLISSDEEAQLLIKGIGRLTDNIHVILSFRKEFLAEFKNLFKSVEVEEFYLKPLDPAAILEAIQGITKSQKASDLYELQFANDEVSTQMAQEILADEQSHIAPLLQILLRKMWDKVKDKKPRIFSSNLFEDVKSNNLETLINDQIEAVKENFPHEVNSGLVLDILNYFTTPRGTSATHANEDLLRVYDNSSVIKVVTELKNKYLLSEPKEEELNTIRLAHDSLAPFIREMYSGSTLPGQRAAILLGSKKFEIENRPDEVEFSETDLIIIDAGKSGMRKWTLAETDEIENSRQKVNERKEREKQLAIEIGEKNKELQIALEEAERQTKLAQAKAMAANARQVFQTDPTLAIRLAEASMQITPVPTNESRNAFLDFIKSENGFAKKVFSHSFDVSSVAFSPDEKVILTGSWDSNLRLWDIEGNLLDEFKGPEKSVTSVAFSPDNKTILAGSSDNTARLWDLKGNQLNEFKGHTETVTSVAFSPDGYMVLTGSYDATARLWNLEGKLLQQFIGHSKEICAVAFSPIGDAILTGGLDGTAKIWHLNGNLIQEFKGHTRDVFSVAFSRLGNLILTGCLNESARLWNLKGKLIRRLEDNREYPSSASVTFSNDGNSILTGGQDNSVLLWDLKGNLLHEFKGHTNGITSVTFSPLGNSILTGSHDNTARLWDLKANILLENKRHFDDEIMSLAFSHDGNSIFGVSMDKTIRQLDLKGNEIKKFKGHEDGVNSIAISPDGGSFLTGSYDMTSILWNLNGKVLQKFKGHSSYVTSVAFSHDGNSILTGSEDNTARLWNLKGQSLQEFSGHSDGVKSVAFSIDDRSVLTGSRDKIARLWDLNGNLLQEFKGHLKAISSVAFSPDGKKVLTGSEDTTTRMWDLQGNIMQEFNGLAVAFSPDGRSILTACSDYTARLWDLQGNILQEFNGYGDTVRSVAFSPNGDLILLGTSYVIRLWRPYWVRLNPKNTVIPTPKEMKQYEIPDNIEWGKKW